MMPDLGKYADSILAAYAVTLAGLAVIVGQSLLRGMRVRRKLAELEERRRRG